MRKFHEMARFASAKKDSQPQLPGLSKDKKMPLISSWSRREIFLGFTLLILAIIFFAILLWCCKQDQSLHFIIKDNRGFYYIARIYREQEGQYSLERLTEKIRNKSKLEDSYLDKAIQDRVDKKEIRFLEPYTQKKEKEVSSEEISPKEKKSRNINKEILPPKEYLGYYTLNIKGHVGKIFLGIYKNRLIGTVRFPNWANGKTEVLKNVRIRKNRISFVRSISTNAERKRIGAPHYFRQEYYGRVYENGKNMKGSMLSEGVKTSWEAKR